MGALWSLKSQIWDVQPKLLDFYTTNYICTGESCKCWRCCCFGLEMTKNSMRLNWPREEVDLRLHAIMSEIHRTCSHFGRKGNQINYLQGANIGGFVKVAEAMMAQGVV